MESLRWGHLQQRSVLQQQHRAAPVQERHVCLQPGVAGRIKSFAPRAQVTSTQTVTKQDAVPAQQQKAAAWSPWSVFGKGKPAAQLSTINEEELWQLLEAEQEVPLVVIFSATWCGPCKIMVQRLENMMKAMGPQGMRAVKIDTDLCPDLATELKVHKLPTMFFIGPHADKPAAHYTGLLPEAVLRDMVQNRRQYLGTNIRQAVSV